MKKPTMLEKLREIQKIESEILMIRTNQHPFEDRELTKSDYELMMDLVDKKLILLEELTKDLDWKKGEVSVEKRDLNLKIA